ncbi:MAG: lipopolysaccharide transport periplasmic protein LptA [Oceanospirillaceae bacterium]
MKNKTTPRLLLQTPSFFCQIQSHHLSFSLKKTRTFWVLLAAISCSQTVSALPEDRNQPIDVVANNAVLDDKTGITTLTGAVKIIQGTMAITADKLVISRNKNGDISKMLATGKPSHFTQQQQKGQPYSKAWGSNMIYSVSEQKITITGNARVEQLKDKFTGEVIVYHMDKAIVNAKGGKQRVKMIIQPKGKK